MVVYKLTNMVNGKIYVGQTVLPLERRWYSHVKKASAKSSMLISRAIAKHGPQNFLCEILCTTEDKTHLDYLEKLWIKLLDARNTKVGYNLIEGGTGGNIIESLPHKNEIYARRAASNTGKKRSGESKKNILNGRKSRNHSESTKEKIRAARLGSRLSIEVKNKISNKLVGRTLTTDHINKLKKINKRPRPGSRKKIIIGTTPFNSLKEASEQLGIPGSTLHSRLNSDKYPLYKYEKY